MDTVYKVRIPNGEPVLVTASYWVIEDGSLIFYNYRNHMVCAFKTWDSVIPE